MTDLVDTVLTDGPTPTGRIGAGTVTSVSPLRVRFAGETADVGVLAFEHVTPVAARQVGLVRFGKQWCIVGQMEAP